ncbi:uncharacterized protein METZ01_LOCUS113514 [marine metagenome]|uniref:Esterase n=1 Tax=marine metagenome TaxID=408172 RepID=A0A381X7R9_9ZZZZ
MKKITLVALIIFQVVVSYGADVDTLVVFSDAMKKKILSLIVIPDEYENESTFASAVMLLHGYGGNYLDWKKHANLDSIADESNFIIICPDGSTNSWYLDSPVDLNSQYETYFIKELIPQLREKYLIDQLAITGLSMGGHGALYLALRNPGTFNAVGSMSGGVDLTYSTKKWEISQKLGSYEQFPNRWHENSIVSMVKTLKGISFPIMIDCGADDFFIDINRTLHAQLLNQDIIHDYVERPGGHKWSYWIDALDYHIVFFKKQL